MKGPGCFQARIWLPDPRIKNAFDRFVERIPSEVLGGLNEFLTEVTQVDQFRLKEGGAGLCLFTVEVGKRHEAAIRLSAAWCSLLSDAALVGVFAHEFGHAEDHLFNGTLHVFDGNAEVEANTRGIAWGFKSEVLALYEELAYSPDDISTEFRSGENIVIDYWSKRAGQQPPAMKTERWIISGVTRTVSRPLAATLPSTQGETLG